MSFKGHEGKIECTKFSDFYRWIMYHPEEKTCPECEKLMDMRMYPTFDMNRFGKAIFICPGKNCTFNKNPIRIEAMGGNTHELAGFHRK